jgi:hypothetical protein
LSSIISSWLVERVARQAEQETEMAELVERVVCVAP